MDQLVNDYLHREHDLITQMINVIKLEINKLSIGNQPDPERFRKIITFCQNYADKVHHMKEEDLLFTHIYPINNIEGGPHCIYYKELQMQRTPVVEQVQQIQMDLGVSQADFLKNWKTVVHEGCIVNPLLEEHILGRNLIALIENEMNALLNGSKKQNGELIYALYRYATMIEEHIEKENVCFAHTVDKYLPKELQKTIVQRFKEMDDGPCAELIRESMQILNELKN